MKKIQRFYYQPDFLNNIISWSWTMLILVVGIIFWLEVTHFNWITAAFFVAFLIVVSIQRFSRTIDVLENEMIIHRFIKSNFSILNLNDIKNVQKKRYSISFEYKNKSFKLLMGHKSVNKLFNILKKG